MSLAISVVCPVKNEFPWIGYSILSALPYVHEFLYAVSPSEDGTQELLEYLEQKYPEKIKPFPYPDFHPHDMAAYNESFNLGISRMTGSVAWFLHPDMIVTKGAELSEGPLAWTVEVASYAGDFHTKITKGRVNRWKNMHAKKFGFHYYGGYGSQNEDFYHADITGTAYKHYGTEFSKYPFDIAESGFSVNHYCELKSYKRRREKMELCLKTQNPWMADEAVKEMAAQHPRVTLQPSGTRYGTFEFEKVNDPIPDVITKYEKEFSQFSKEKELING